MRGQTLAGPLVAATVALAGGAAPAHGAIAATSNGWRQGAGTTPGGQPGRWAPAIVGGRPAAAGAWPWLAFISDRLGPADDEFCTGTVIAPKVVLTAAHCVEDLSDGSLDHAADFTVTTGSSNRAGGAGRQLSSVMQVIAHATNPQTPLLPGGAGSVNVVGDAGLLVLVTATRAPAIRLASGGGAPTAPGTTGAIAGWGLTGPRATTPPTSLRAASTVIESPAYCARRNPEFDPHAQLCTIGTPGDRASFCNGDSGAPLVTRGSTGWVQVGIASTSIACDPALPDTFTSVGYVGSWVTAWRAALQAPVAAPLSAPAAPAAPSGVTYGGRTSQPRGHLTITLDADGRGVARLTLAFTTYCPRGSRGPLVARAAWRTSLPLRRDGRARQLAATYLGMHGWLYSVVARVPAAGPASGTVGVISRNGACQTGTLAWRAAPNAVRAHEPSADLHQRRPGQAPVHDSGRLGV